MLSILPFDGLSQRDTERPFKAYPRTPVTLPSSSYYGTFNPSPSLLSSAYPNSQSVSVKRSPSELSNMDHMRQMTSQMYDHHSTPTMGDMSHANLPRHLMQPYPILKQEHDMQHQMAPRHMLDLHHEPYKPAQHQQSYSNGDSHVDPLHVSPGSQDKTSPSDAVTSSTSIATRKSENTQATESSSFKMPPKKRPLAVPEEHKDTGYWDKRKKNNDSAKRSREARRMKEEQIAMRVVYLEQDNLQLRTEVSLLKSEIEKLRCMLYNS